MSTNEQALNMAAAGGGGGMDLLKRATQSLMMSRSAVAPVTADDDTNDTGYDTPRSGVATPQPDPHDRRLPGIMSYFAQVSSILRFRSASSPASPATGDGKADSQQSPVDPDLTQHDPQGLLVATTPPVLPHERSPKDSRQHAFIYPTPPMSQRPSASTQGECNQDWSPATRPAAPQGCESIAMQRSTSAGPAVPMVTTQAVEATHFSATGFTVPSTPARCQSPAPVAVEEPEEAAPSCKDVGVTLTNVIIKSGPTTPTRALSTAHPSQSEARDDFPGPSGTQTPKTFISSGSSGAQAPTAKGKLTIKIMEARGLRKSKDPYVVAVFQRNELISSGPRTFNDQEDERPPVSIALGGLAIQRTGSDSGRAMAIPMRSRQSSNTSIGVGDYATARNRTRRSFTHPQWDAEAVFDVVDGDLLVDLSVYDHSPTGEIFLGHVDFQANFTESVSGWFPLRGNADTTAENAPTGEILVEATYQRTDRKHYGPEDFQILRLIGKGTFGQVYQVRKRDTKRIYAMKVLSKKVIVQKKEVAHTVGERNILVRTAMSDSPFIVGLKFSFQTPSDLYLVTDYMSGGELFWHLQKEGRFDEKRAKFYIAELILAIQHLHNNDIVYRDLKPENILLDANGHIALCDFGLSKANLTKNDTTNTFCGTTEYLAPEVLLDEQGYTKMVDFWSLGVLVFEMCCGWSPFYAEDTQQMYKNIAFGKVRFPRDTLSVEGRNFVKGLLNRNPKHRLGATHDAEELKQHPFFADIDWDALSKKLITPPFKPQLKSETDVSYFDPEFTNALNNNGSLNERAAALARGFATSTPLSPSVQANFQGFTYVDESSLEDHMSGRRGYEDEEMDDAHHDNDWDDLHDIDTRQANRMSGIERTGTNDEHMFGAGHFDI